MNIIWNILSGYARFFKELGSFIIKVFLLCFFSFLIVFPQWYFAIHYKLGYNIFVFSILTGLVLLYFISRIIRNFKKGNNLRKESKFRFSHLLDFIILLLELGLIRYFLSSNNIFFISAGTLFTCEFLFYLCIIKRKQEYLRLWMQTLLIILISLEIFYSISVFYTRGNYFFSVSLLVVYLCTIGYLIYNPRKINKVRKKEKLLMYK